MSVTIENYVRSIESETLEYRTKYEALKEATMAKSGIFKDLLNRLGNIWRSDITGEDFWRGSSMLASDAIRIIKQTLCKELK